MMKKTIPEMLIKFPYDEKRLKFVEYVRYAHNELHPSGKPQERKYTGEPYWTHPVQVANELYRHGYKGYEIEVALGHDLIEDTMIGANGINEAKRIIFEKLIEFDYFEDTAYKIVIGIIHLTDVYTKEEFPTLNRKTRKEFERVRLMDIPPNIQTVKYCDNIHNSETILERDLNFAKVYCEEILENLKTMNKGDATIYNKLINILNEYNNKVAN